MSYLLDTNIISELRKKQPNSHLLDWFHTTEKEQLFISCLTLGEIKQGIVKLEKKDNEQAFVISKWLNMIQNSFSSRILRINIESSLIWGKFMAMDTTNPIDALIAAQAYQHNLTMVTRNLKHISKLPVRSFNPFSTTP
ncbi:MAG: vapC3 [Rickettsiaceae bacterium]|jgi:predicted nucleic acid-binding protein|nr:vapC3 [Rickettsiaceae bacterium]